MAKNRMTPGSNRFHLPGSNPLGTLCEPLRLAQGKAPLRNLVNTTNAANCPECAAMVYGQPVARLRTAHDRAALQGHASWSLSGNPTLDERKRQDEHDASRAAQARDAIPTLAEVMAAGEWVVRGDGSIVPVRLDRATGWGDDADRDSQAAQELARLVKGMDVMCESVVSREPDGAALTLARTWQSIRKITRENGGK